MSYEIVATSLTPQLVIYLLDVSASMKKEMSDARRIDVVSDALTAALRRMVFVSTKGGRLSPRYHVAMYAYSDEVWDLLGGIQPLDKVAAIGVPELSTLRSTDTAQAFLVAEQLLQANIAEYDACPAPLVCHLTDGQYTADDPEPVALRIRDLAVADGHVLVENIFVTDSVLEEPVDDPFSWPGIVPGTQLASQYARKLAAMSSVLPESYRVEMLEMGYNMLPGALMMLPGETPQLVAMGFQMSGVTKLY
jgi:uncharacterized protein YegL